MIKALIIDDEQHCLDDLSTLLKEFKEKINVVGTAKTVDNALRLTLEKKPDLVFLDVQLGKLTGFHFLRSFKKVPFQVVFTTAYEKYAIQAIKVSAFDFLLKPIELEELNHTIQRLDDNQSELLKQKKLEVLFESLKSESLPKEVILPTQFGFEVVKILEILFCEADENYTKVYLSNSDVMLVSKSLKYFDEIFELHSFFRIHKSHLVNLDYVKKYHKGKGGYVVLNNGTSLTVSQRKKEGFLKAMEQRARSL